MYKKYCLFSLGRNYNTKAFATYNTIATTHISFSKKEHKICPV